MKRNSPALIAAMLGLGLMGGVFPSSLGGPTPFRPQDDDDEPKEKTEKDFERMRKAQEKRDRKAAKLKAQQEKNVPGK